MVIEVKVSAVLRFYVKFPERFLKGDRVEVPEGATVDQILQRLSFPERINVFVVLNGIPSDRGKVLKEGDEMHVLAPLSGG